ncbi:polymorphic toxin-type HINT domain-containing protein [Parachitinimonas caeni]|uniref:Polymorphic toxin-type HINT domain-containing protein n=1 Tax=Parachitinimonas caeni TaxID=3031301 RepID=A0ABT7E426_9NEIS|nr:polymorphic toxin-type HINT domain-containing protein [Parachitinimonas caeni]MDK2127069.1 polymorphic toxin-type HINT domain-containing protein [Parachitinimonas caeni]
MSELTTGTAFGAGLSFIGNTLGRIPKGYSKVHWSAPSHANALPVRIVSATGARVSAELSSSLANTAGTSIYRSAGGVLTTPSGNRITLPKEGSMNSEEAFLWLREQKRQIGNWIDPHASAQERAFQAVSLDNSFKIASRNAMDNSFAAAQLSITDSIRHFDEIVQKEAAARSGDCLFNKIIADATHEVTQLRRVTQPGGCFVAGTPVWTKNGPVPIEQIKVGDLVLSQPEDGGELDYRPVVNTFEHDDKELWLVQYGKDSMCSIVCTGNHPFWVEGIGWTAAEKLKLGDILKSSDGRAAGVFRVLKLFNTEIDGVGWAWDYFFNSSYGGPAVDIRNGVISSDDDVAQSRVPDIVSGKKIEGIDIDAHFNTSFKSKVFNLEVDGFHTYYVGDESIWVHNTNCGEEGVHFLDERLHNLGLLPSPNTPVYSSSQAVSKLPPPHVGEVLIKEKTSGTKEQIAFQDGTIGAMKTADGASVAHGIRYPNSDPKGEMVIRFDGRIPMPDGSGFSKTYIDGRFQL